MVQAAEAAGAMYSRSLALLLLLIPSLARAQGSHFSGVALNSNGTPVPNASIIVCAAAASGTPCSPISRLCTDVTCTNQSAPNPVTADSIGKFAFYALPGRYEYQVTGPGVTSPTQVNDLVLPCDPSTDCTTRGNLAGLIPSSALCGVTGSDASAKIQCAINLLPSAGGVVDARYLTDSGGTGSTTIDPGTKAVTILLGPSTYTISQVVLRTDTHIIGAGMGEGTASGVQPTILQSCSTCGSTDAMAINVSHGAAQHVVLDGFRLYATPGNTAQRGMNFVTNNSGGMWYSEIRNVCVGACGPGITQFMGGNIILDGTNTSSPGFHQWIRFTNVQAFRSSSSGLYDLWIKGLVAMNTFLDCQFDGPGPSDTGTNIWIGDGSTGLGSAPVGNMFIGLTCQSAGTCMSLNGSWSTTVMRMHNEAINGGTGGIVTLVNGATNSNLNVTIEDSQIQTPASYIIQNNDSGAQVRFERNWITNTPTAYFTGSHPERIFPAQNFGPSNGSVPSQSGFEVSRIRYGAGTQLTIGAFAFASNWGTGPAFNSVRGTDSLFQLTLTSGSGSPGANPQVQLTFVDGTWTNVPICFIQPASAAWVVDSSSTATLLKLDFQGTPAASTQYTINVTCGQSPN